MKLFTDIELDATKRNQLNLPLFDYMFWAKTSAIL